MRLLSRDVTFKVCRNEWLTEIDDILTASREHIFFDDQDMHLASSSVPAAFAALVIDLALFRPPLPLSPRDLMPAGFTLKDPI